MKSISYCVAVLFSSLVFSWAGINTPIHPEYKKQVETTLSKSGENRSELIKALNEVPKNHRKAMEFLIAYMPASDATSVKASLLLNNVEWAYKARETFPWAKEVPEDVFFNDVLPYASLNERRDDWREDFFKRFSKIVKSSKTQKEAIFAVNNKIRDELKVDYNTSEKKPIKALMSRWSRGWLVARGCRFYSMMPFAPSESHRESQELPHGQPNEVIITG